MVFDSLENFNNYVSLNRNFELVSGFLSETPVDKLETKRYELKDGNYVMFNSYSTKPVQECFIECHRKYIDVQIMISGTEKVGICNLKDCTENEYDPVKDFSVLKGDTDIFTLKEGQFTIFFPHDGHMPGISIAATPQIVKKLVFKILV